MTNQKPQISVCIPTYEMHGVGVEYLQHSLSLLTQQDFTNFEVIVSDQSADDKIKQCCQQFSSKLNIRHIFNTKAKHQSSTNLNNAMRYAQAEIIKVLFQDDFIHRKDALSILFTVFSKSPAKWCITRMARCNEEGICLNPGELPFYHRLIYLGYNTLGMPTALALKNKNILEFDENLIWLMDTDYYQCCYQEFGKPLIIDDDLASVRLHKNQVSHSISKSVMLAETIYVWNKFRHQRRLLDWVGYLKRGIISAQIRKALGLAAKLMPADDNKPLDFTDNDKLPPIFVISLAKDKARRDYIKKQFAKYQLRYQFIDAVDGASLDKDAINKVYANEQTLKKMRRPLTKSEIGCALSHISVYHKMLKENIPEAIVFEDDVMISKSFFRVMKNIHQVLPKNWELLLLGYRTFYYIFRKKAAYYVCFKKITRASKKHNFSIIKPLSVLYGTHAYLINQQGAERLIKQSQPLSRPIDHYTSNYRMIDVYSVKPECAGVNMDFTSSIENERLSLASQARIQKKQVLSKKYWLVGIVVKVRRRLICIVHKVNYFLGG